jgi:hypothetical protein
MQRLPNHGIHLSFDVDFYSGVGLFMLPQNGSFGSGVAAFFQL